MKYLIIILLLISPFAYAEAPEQIQADAAKQKAIKLAREDLANLLNIEKDEIRVKSAEKAVWPDSALGFAHEKGRFYIQVLTDGYKIILCYNGRDYEYHTNSTNHIKLDPKTALRAKGAK